uniref:PHR domain-containing protein n=1 Tax=Macaca mulatta TaxID=9544 RepID=A0A5F8ACZ7_MACMU
MGVTGLRDERGGGGGPAPAHLRLSLGIHMAACYLPRQVLSQQAHLCGGIWAVWIHPRAHRLPSEHPGTRPKLPPQALPRLHSCPCPVPTSVEPWPNPRPWSLHCPPWAGGLGLEGSLSALPRPEPPTSLQIIHTDSNTVLGQNDTGFSCDGSASTFRVMFKEPVEVLPNVNYTACATLKVCRWGVGSLRGSLWPILRPPGHSRHSPDVATLAQLGPRPVHTWGIPAWRSLTSLYPIPTGPRLPLRHQRPAQGDTRVAHHGCQDLLHLLLRGREQQWHIRGGRPDPRGHLLHLGCPTATPPSLCGEGWGPEAIFYTWATRHRPPSVGTTGAPRSSTPGLPCRRPPSMGTAAAPGHHPLLGPPTWCQAQCSPGPSVQSTPPFSASGRGCPAFTTTSVAAGSGQPGRWPGQWPGPVETIPQDWGQGCAGLGQGPQAHRSGRLPTSSDGGTRRPHVSSLHIAMHLRFPFLC